MSLLLLGLASLLHAADTPAAAQSPTGAPNAVAICDFLERKTDRDAVEIHDFAKLAALSDFDETYLNLFCEPR